ncbi:hypothetical protein [Neobacillus mesonae]|uniref:hypothetical protein n=1 Tax=Neobacillus mesonae TaxID=1193713 RepID=UPI0020426915|nr:hypothetical protein [Neobacillus mesonae]MCM3569530.1 hypothetical protein [Neobacillus mesonae]
MNPKKTMIPPLCCLNTALKEYICILNEMVSALLIRKNENHVDVQLSDTIKHGVVPQLQFIADLQRLLLRKIVCLLEQYQLDDWEFSMEDDSSLQRLKIIELYRGLNQFCPNDELVDETIESLLKLETQKAKILQSITLFKRNNDPKTVWKPN